MITRAIVPFLVLTALAASSGGCSVDKKTQITVALSSETEIPKELDEFYIRVVSTRTGEIRFEHSYTAEDGHVFPTTLAVIPYDEDSLGSPVSVYLEGRKRGAAFLVRQSIASYVKDRNILLTMPLRMACFQFKDCGPSATCAGGQCVDAKVDTSKALDFEDRYVFGDKGACFDEQACLSGAVEVTVDPETCTFTIPEGTATGLGNVAIRWAAAPERLLGLEAEDAQEGWTRAAPGVGKLSAGACDSHFQKRGTDGKLLVSDWAKAVYFAPACPTKTAVLPHCFSQATNSAGAGAILP
jgi:hypothetical protein